MEHRPRHPILARLSQNLFSDALFAIVAAWIAANLFVFFLARFAAARFWEAWATSHASMVRWLPIVVLAIAAGALVGMCLGLIFKRRSTRIALFSALSLIIIALFSWELQFFVATVVLGLGITGAAIATDKIISGSAAIERSNR